MLFNWKICWLLVFLLYIDNLESVHGKKNLGDVCQTTSECKCVLCCLYPDSGGGISYCQPRLTKGQVCALKPVVTDGEYFFQCPCKKGLKCLPSATNETIGICQ